MKKRYATRFAIRAVAIALGIGAATLIAGSASPANAQAGDNITAQQAIHDLKADYGVVIIPSDRLDLARSVSGSVVDVSGATSSQAVDGVAADMNARAQKVFIVVPASTSAPVTTMADAEAFRGPTSTVTLQLIGVPAKDAIDAIASAADAKADIRGDIGQQTVDIAGSNMDIAQAIAEVAAETHTHWVQAYELTPRPETVVARNRYHRAYNEEEAMNYYQGLPGAITVHLPPPPVQTQETTTSPAVANPQGNAVAESNPVVNQSQATPTEPVSPYDSSTTTPYGYGMPDTGYSPYYMMQNGYAYSPDGVPYPQTWGGFTNGGFSPSSGLYLLPGYGYGYPYGAAPLVSGGGTSITTGF